MSLSRLLLAKPGHHFNKTALPKSTRWCSSSVNNGVEKSSSIENSEAAKEQGAAAEEMDNKCVEMHSGVFPNPTKGPNKTGGSWIFLKSIFTNLKERVLRNPQIQKPDTVKTFDSAADRTVSEAAKTQDSPHNTEVGQPTHSIQMPKVIRDSHSSKDDISMSLRYDMVGENSSSEVVDATASSQADVHKHLDCAELGETEGTVHTSRHIVCSSGNLVELVVSQIRKEHVGPGNVQNNSTYPPSQKMGENSLSNLVGDMAACRVKKEDAGPRNAQHGVTESVVQSLEAFLDSQDNEKCVTATAEITRKISSKDKGKPEVKPKPHVQLEKLMSDCIGVLESKIGEDSSMLQKDVLKAFTVENRNHQLDKGTLLCDQTPNAGTGVGKITASSSGTQEVGLESMFIRTMHDQKASEMPNEERNGTLAWNGLLDIQNERNEATKAERNIGKGFNINGLIGCIKELPREPSINKSQDCADPSKTIHIINRGGSVKNVQSHAGSQKHDVKGRKSLLKGHTMVKESQIVSGSEGQPCKGMPSVAQTDSASESDRDDSKVACLKKQKLNPLVHFPTAKEDLSKILSTFSSKEGSMENKVLVRFLPKNVQAKSIADTFKHCGSTKIQLLPSIEGSDFRDSLVRFKTREGLQKAFLMTDLVVEKCEVFLEAISSDVPNKVSVPKLIGDPEVPPALVKNPTRTVMIKQLTHDISSHELKEALAFCGSGISSFIMGSSSFVGYVEFETEDAKERAIAACSINVQGEQLSIFRIDVPRTTVIRISNLYDERVPCAKILAICYSLGKVKKVNPRGRGRLDIFFKLAEWPNMLTILNSLNGVEVDSTRWVAQPAPLFPPSVLQVLWSQPDERIHVISVLRRLLQRSELTVQIDNLVTKN